MEIRNPARDSESQTGALGLRAGAVAAIESLEDAGQLVRWNPDACVGHDRGALPVPGHNIELHPTTARRVLDRVVEPDQQQPARERRIGGDPSFFPYAHRAAAAPTPSP